MDECGLSDVNSMHTLDQLDRSITEGSENQLLSKKVKIGATSEQVKNYSVVTENFTVQNFVYARYVMDSSFYAVYKHKDLTRIVNPILMKCVTLYDEIFEEYLAKLSHAPRRQEGCPYVDSVRARQSHGKP